MFQLLLYPNKLLLPTLNLVLVVPVPGRITRGREELGLPHIFAHGGVRVALGHRIEEEILTHNANLTPFRRGCSVVQELGKDSPSSSLHFDGLFFGEGRTILVLHECKIRCFGCAVVDNDQRDLIP